MKIKLSSLVKMFPILIESTITCCDGQANSKHKMMRLDQYSQKCRERINRCQAKTDLNVSHLEEALEVRNDEKNEDPAKAHLHHLVSERHETKRLNAGEDQCGPEEIQQ